MASRLANYAGLDADPMLKPAFQVMIPGVNMEGSYIKEVRAPQPSIGLEEHYVAGHRVQTAGFKTQEPLVMSFYEDESGKILDFYHKWSALVFDPETGIYGLPSAYKKDVSIEILNRDDDVAVTIKGIGCWPRSIIGYEFDVSAEGAGSNIEPTITFSVDYFEYEWSSKALSRNSGSVNNSFTDDQINNTGTTRNYNSNWPWNIIRSIF